MCFNNFLDYGDEYIEKLLVDEDKSRKFLLVINSSIYEQVHLKE